MKKLILVGLILVLGFLSLDACIAGFAFSGKIGFKLPGGDLFLIEPNVSTQRVTPRPPAPEPVPGTERLPTTTT